MPSRQDQMHSYQFMVSRVVAALVVRDTDPASSPFQRVAGATLASVLLAALALGGVAAYGLIAPGGSARWRSTNVVITEKDTGAKYVYRDGVLYPVANYASALLVMDAAGARTVAVAHDSLDGVPRGPLLGIPGAPDALPPVKRLLRGSWTVCSRPTPSGPTSVLSVGTGVGGGESVGGAQGAGGAQGGATQGVGGAPVGKGLLLSTADGAQYLVWGGYRHLVRDAQRVDAALLWANRQIQVSPALIDALPAGQDIHVPDVGADRGRPVSRPAGARIGQVFRFKRSDTAAVEYVTPTATGMVELTALEAALLLNDPKNAGSASRTEASDLSRADLAAVLGSVVPLAPRDAAGALPENPPDLLDHAPSSICTGVDGIAARWIRYDVVLPSGGGAPTTGVSPLGAVLADRVVVAPGSGALVNAVSSAGAPSGEVSIVTDLGTAYAIPGSEAQARLGYGGVTPVDVPVEFVALLPRGPSLDPVAAKMPVGR